MNAVLRMTLIRHVKLGEGGLRVRGIEGQQQIVIVLCHFKINLKSSISYRAYSFVSSLNIPPKI